MSSDVAVQVVPDYLAPYVDAARVYDGGFRSLLWATRQTQAARFDAICRLENPRGRSIADLGCGRADLLDFCIARGTPPADYVGIEAVPKLAGAARNKRHTRATIIEADFVENPASMFVGADLVILCGSLNTLDDDHFQSTIRRAFDAATLCLVFNFLCSPNLACLSYLHWRERDEVERLARSLSHDLRFLDDYLHGDCTIAIGKD